MTRVIKNNSPLDGVRTVGRAAALNVANFAEQAQKLVLDAQAKAAQTLQNATARARELEQQASERGYAEGFAKGRADGQADGAEKAFAEATAGFQKQTASLQQLLRQAIQGLEAARADLLLQARSDLLNLSIAIAEKVTGVQAAGQLQVAQASLGKALDMLAEASQVQVRVCARQVGQLREYAAGLADELSLGEAVRLVPDETLQPGDVVVTTRSGEIDARIQTQLDNVVSALTGQEGPA